MNPQTPTGSAIKRVTINATITPEGVWIDRDPATGRPLRCRIDGVVFEVAKVPERTAWWEWPRLSRRQTRQNGL